MTSIAEICRNMIAQKRLDKIIYYFVFENKCPLENLIGHNDITTDSSIQCNVCKRDITDKWTRFYPNIKTRKQAKGKQQKM